MRSTFLSRTRKWIGASALAILVGLSGGTAFLATSSPMAAGAGDARPPRSPRPPSRAMPGFADLVDCGEARRGFDRRRGPRQHAPTLDEPAATSIRQLPDLPDDNPLKKFFDQFGNGRRRRSGRQRRPAPAGPQATSRPARAS